MLSPSPSTLARIFCRGSGSCWTAIDEQEVADLGVLEPVEPAADKWGSEVPLPVPFGRPRGRRDALEGAGGGERGDVEAACHGVRMLLRLFLVARQLVIHSVPTCSG